jgi:hypothetical protein
MEVVLDEIVVLESGEVLWTETHLFNPTIKIGAIRTRRQGNHYYSQGTVRYSIQ